MAAMDVPRNYRNYYLGVLFRGERHLTRGTPEQQELLARHLTYNRRRAEEGPLKAFGPLRDDGDIVAVSVMDVGSLAEAQALLDEDPAVQAGHCRAEAHPLFWPSLDAVTLEYAS